MTREAVGVVWGARRRRDERGADAREGRERDRARLVRMPAVRRPAAEEDSMVCVCLFALMREGDREVFGLDLSPVE